MKSIIAAFERLGYEYVVDGDAKEIFAAVGARENMEREAIATVRRSLVLVAARAVFDVAAAKVWHEEERVRLYYFLTNHFVGAVDVHALLARYEVAPGEDYLARCLAAADALL